MEHNDLRPDNGSSSRLAARQRSAVALVSTSDFREKIVSSILQPKYKHLFLSSIHHLTSLFHRLRLAQLQAELTAYAQSFSRYIHDHPFETLFAVLCIFVVATVPVILPSVGFLSTGPAAGSLAAAWQSAIGVVAAGSPFAVLQSAAMGGVAAGVFYGVGAAGLAGLAAKKGWEWCRGRRERNSAEERTRR